MRNVCVQKGIGVMAQNKRAMGKYSSSPARPVWSRDLVYNLTTGIGVTPTHVRNTAQTVFDHEPKMITLLPNEAGFPGARRGRNLCVFSEDPESRTTAFVANTTVSGKEFTYSAVDGSYYQKNDLLAGSYKTGVRKFICSVDIKLGTYTGPIGVRALCGADNGKAVISGLSTTEYKRVSVTITTDAYESSNMSLGFDNRASIMSGVDTGVGTFFAKNWQIEDSTGRVDTTTPSEYISTDVLSYPYHGTGVDGTQCFPTTNGNTVLNNVVTEGIGTQLHPYVGGKYAYYKPREDSTAYAVGDRIITAIGGYPAGGNGFYYECIKAGTSAASEGSFDTDISDGTFVTNGTFDGNADNWTLGGSSVYNSGAVDIDVPSVTIGLTQTIPTPVIGKSYMVKYTISNYSVGSLRFQLAGANGTYRNANGTYYETITAASTFANLIFINGGNAFTATIDDISVVEVTEDGTVAWENKGMYRMAKFQHEPASTNEILQARQFDTTWTEVGTPLNNASTAQDQVGIDGVANKAWTLHDDATAFEGFRANISVGVEFVTMSIRFKKTTSASSFPGMTLVLGADIGQATVNTDDGTIIGRIGSVPDGLGVIDRGDYWEAWISHENTSSATRQAYVYIAVNTDASGTWVASTTGTCVVDGVQFEKNRKTPTSFIDTTTAPVTRNISELTFSSTGVINQAQGTVMCDWRPHYDLADSTLAQKWIITTASTGRFLYAGSGSGHVATYDGTSGLISTLSYVDRVNYNLTLTWGGATKKLFTDGNADGTGAYDGSWADGGTIYIGKDNAVNSADSANIGNVKFFRRELSDAEIAAAA